MNQRAERAIGLLFGLSVADPAPRKQIRAVAHIQAVSLFPSDELKILVLSFHLLAALSTPGAFHRPFRVYEFWLFEFKFWLPHSAFCILNFSPGRGSRRAVTPTTSLVYFLAHARSPKQNTPCLEYV